MIPKRTALSRRAFSVELASNLGEEPNPRHLKRIHVAAEVLKASKICAGDVLVLRAMDLVDSMDKLSLSGEEVEEKFALGVAWPSFTLSGLAIQVSPLLAANAGIAIGGSACVMTLETSGIQLEEASKITCIYDGKGRKQDSFFDAYVKQVIVDLKFLALHHFIEVVYNGITRRLLVSSIKPQKSTSCAVIVGRNTIVFLKSPEEPAKPTVQTSANAYEEIGGMEAQIEQIRELVEWPLTRPEIYTHLNLKPPKGILLYGPPGTGKTLLASSIARSTNSNLYTIDGPSLSSAFHGETESKIRDIFLEACKNSPAVIVIDEVDAIAPNREDAGEVDKRVVATLLTLMDGLDSKPHVSEDGVEGEKPRVVVIAATNRPNAVDPALRRPGRFDKEIEIGVPNASSRLSILQVLLKKTPHAISDDSLLGIANKTHGFVGADLSSLVHATGLAAIKRTFPRNHQIATQDIASLTIQPEDMEHALLSIRPSAMREVFLETPKVYWSDIGGQETVKARLRECVEWPLLYPESFKRLGVKPPRGVLLYGPPGCSKTLIAKALATEGGLNFIAVKGPEIFNKYVGESEKAVREIFRKARAAAPSVVFLDEVDSLAISRGSDQGGSSDRVLLSLLTEMDGIEELNGVVVLAATNRPDVIDPALMRPGRLDRILYVAPPDQASRVEIFRVHFKKMAIDSAVNIEELAIITEGCTGAEISSVCQDAAMMAMNENVHCEFVGKEHLISASRTVRRRVTAEMIQEYETWRDSSGVQSA